MPGSTASGSAGFTLTVNGTGFATSSVVYFNGTAHNTTFATSKQITADIPAADVANPGTVPVFVRNSGGQYGGGVNSNTMNFTVN